MIDIRGKIAGVLSRLLWSPLCLFFYGDDRHKGWYEVKTYLIWQKIFRINGEIPWMVHPTSRITNWRNIELKERCRPGASIGNYIQAGNGIKIGKNVLIAPNVGIISANHKRDGSGWEKADPIIIGDNVWIGMNAVILPGVKIGENSVIGAGSIVNKDIPANCMAAGNPCKIIKRIS